MLNLQVITGFYHTGELARPEKDDKTLSDRNDLRLSYTLGKVCDRDLEAVPKVEFNPFVQFLKDKNGQSTPKRVVAYADPTGKSLLESVSES
jgi:hypothetical protein